MKRAAAKFFLLVFAVAARAASAAVVYNVPPSTPPMELLAGQTLNLYAGGLLPSGSFTSRAGSVVNMYDGRAGFGTSFQGKVNIFDGLVDGYSYFAPTSVVDMYGGLIVGLGQLTEGTFHLHGGRLSAPQLGHLGPPIRSATFTMDGGVLGPQAVAAAVTMDVSGGEFQHPFSIGDYSTLNLKVKEVTLGGQPIPGITPGVSTLITARDLILAGKLADGSPFSFNMESDDLTALSQQTDLFRPQATVTVTLVPEPSAAGIALIACWLTTLPRCRRGLL